MSQTQSSLWRNGAPAAHDLTDGSCWNANVHRVLILADFERLEKLFK
jgi:hypothetical protein